MAVKMNHKSMSMGALQESFQKFKLKKPTQSTVPAYASVLKAHFEKVTVREDLSACSTCGGISDFNLDQCPYCGDSEKTDANIANATQAIDTTAEPVTAVATKSGGYVEIKPEELDESLAKVKELKKNAERSIWELGIEIKHLHDEELWKARMIAGEPQYKTWKQFCGTELGMSHQHAYNLMEVAGKFTREQVEQYGVAKLSIIASLPGEQRPAALAGADGKSKRQLADEAKEASGKGDKGDAGDKITFLARADKKTTLKFLAASGEKGKPAQAIADEPWVEEEHENGVVSRYVIKQNNRTGNLELVITRRR